MTTMHQRQRAWSNAFPACRGNCAQGSKLCTTPQECLLSDGDRTTAQGVLVAVVLALALWALIALAWVAMS